MKASTFAVALAIALATTTGFAVAADKPAVTSDQTWYQAGEFKVQAEQARAELEGHGFPQYIR